MYIVLRYETIPIFLQNFRETSFVVAIFTSDLLIPFDLNYSVL